MAKKALIEKQQRKPKFKVRAYTRCQRCGRPQVGVPQVRAVPHLPPRARRTPARSPASRRRAGEGGERDDDDRSRSPTCSPASATPTWRCTTRCACRRSKLKEALAAVLKKEGYIEGFAVADDPERPGPGRSTITMKYSPERERTISGVARVSKPGLRVYTQGRQGPPRARRPRRRRRCPPARAS